MNNRVVITGLGLVSPIGIELEDFVSNLKQGKSGVRFFEKDSKYDFNLNYSCLVENTSTYDNVFEKYKLYNITDAVKFAILASYKALENSKLLDQYEKLQNADYDTGVILGTLAGQKDLTLSTNYVLQNRGCRYLRSNIAEQAMYSGASSLISGIWALANYNSTSSMACASSTDAIVQSYYRIKFGLAKRMLAGGYDSVSDYLIGIFKSLGIIVTNNYEKPEYASCPLSVNASGFVPGEGAGVLVLEDLETAIKRGATIYGEIIGASSNAGGQRNGGTMSAPSNEGVQKCMKDCMINANINSSEIDYVSGHLTSTMADVLEVNNISKVLEREARDFPYISSLKSMIGHTLGAAGAIETIAALMQMKESFLHPSLNCTPLHPEIEKIVDNSKIPQTTMNDIDINTIMKLSFGFGDVNSCLIIKKYIK